MITILKKSWRIAGISLIAAGLFISCSSWQPELGEDLLPPGDDVFLYHDTIFEISSRLVSGKPLVTSEINYSSTNVYLLGTLKDSITGLSTASIFTQYNLHSSFTPAPNTEIDSVILYLYIPEYQGNIKEPVTFGVYEATERTYMDSLYYSDHDPEGHYNPVMIGEIQHQPAAGGDTVEIMITDESFKQKFLNVAEDTSLFTSDSVFKDYFNGLYLTAEASGERGVMAEVGLSNVYTRLTLRYANDSTDVDSTEAKDFIWATFPINEYSSQKINIFGHDYTGSSLESIIDRDSIELPYVYVQGISGVNTLLNFDHFQDWFGGEKISVSSAKLIFDVVPEDAGGFPVGELPGNLMLYTQKDNGDLEFLYDWQANYDSQNPSIAFSVFGGELETVSKGMFFDTTYRYTFNINLHFQYMTDGAKSDSQFRLRSAIPKTDTKIAKLWSNLFDNPARIRVEVVYLKL